jgi:hypothetical protein
MEGKMLYLIRKIQELKMVKCEHQCIRYNSENNEWEIISLEITDEQWIKIISDYLEEENNNALRHGKR